MDKKYDVILLLIFVFQKGVLSLHSQPPPKQALNCPSLHNSRKKKIKCICYSIFTVSSKWEESFMKKTL